MGGRQVTETVRDRLRNAWQDFVEGRHSQPLLRPGHEATERERISSHGTSMARIALPSGVVSEIAVDSGSETVRMLKQRIATLHGLRGDHVALEACGNLLQDNWTLAK